ncbi:MAG TPA: DUF2846 domain-containing protein [Parasulfuritortus sp.]
MKKLLFAVLVASALSGCASVPMGDAKQDAALKTFTVPADKGGIYVYRNESFGAAVKMDVALDGKPLGQTAAKTFLYTEVAPGKHTITSEAENTDTLDVDVKPGTLTYVWQEVKMGILYARTKLHLMNDADGKAGVLETHLAQSK